MIKIRKARPEDYKEIAELRKQTFEKVNGKDYTKMQIRVLNKRNPPEKILEKMKKRDMFCLIKNNEILGVVDLRKNIIGGFFIKHTSIKKGLGTKLLNFIENHAKKKGIKKVILYSTIYARPFYIKHGYRKIRKAGWSWIGMNFTTYKMKKELK